MDDKRLERIEIKLDMVVDKIGKIDTTLASQHVSLVEHTRRSAANEKAVALLSEELKPIITHVAMVKLGIKALFAMILASGVLKFLLQVLK